MSDIHDAIAAWHDDPEDERPLHEYLEMTWEQYARWAEVGELPEGSPYADSDKIVLMSCENSAPERTKP